MKSKYMLISVFIAVVLITCKDQQENHLPLEAVSDNRIVLSTQEFQSMKLKLGSIRSIEVPHIVRVNGVIDVPPANKVIVSAVRGGYVNSTPPVVGSEVKKGELIISIENPEFIELQQTYLEVFQQLKYLQYEYDRHTKMKAENVISEKRFMESENELKTTQARYMGLKKQLELLSILPSEVEKGHIFSNSSIYAPISGTITSVGVSKGSFISPEKEILEIVNTDHIHLELFAFEKDVLKIKKGQAIEFRIPESSDQVYQASVFLINNTIDENRTIQVHAHIEESNVQTFIIGMFVEAEIHIDHFNVNVLPTQSLVDSDGSPHVLVLDEKQDGQLYFKHIAISTGEDYGEFTEVKELKSDAYKDKILVHGIQTVLSKRE